MSKCQNGNLFNNKDYSSGDGMLTSVWGPSLWHSLHVISFNYPVNPTCEQKKQYYNFFMSLKNILPCKYCRENYKKNIKTIPLNMSVMKNRHTLSKWLYELHEEINKMLGKNSNLTFDNVRERYEMFRARCLNDNKGIKKAKGKQSKKKKKAKGKLSKKEKGCVKPLYGVKSKCIINIVPRNKRCKSFNIDKQCVLKRIK